MYVPVRYEKCGKSRAQRRMSRSSARPSLIESISEHAFKLAPCEILGDDPKHAWGGETSDHFTDHLHLEGRRVSGAFVLKGPARFKPIRHRAYVAWPRDSPNLGELLEVLYVILEELVAEPHDLVGPRWIACTHPGKAH